MRAAAGDQQVSSAPERYCASLREALGAAERGGLEEWVHGYLRGEGGNAAFSDGLRRAERFYAGPFMVPLRCLARCCGPEPGMAFRVDAGAFEARVGTIEARLARGDELPPLILNYRRDALIVNDGNHRLEAFTRRGFEELPAIIWVSRAGELRAFERRYAGLVRRLTL